MSIETVIATFSPTQPELALALETAMIEGGILSLTEKCHFLAQMAHESVGFTRTTEGLNYSAKRLREIFPKYFPTQGIANLYARQPAKIANRAYGNRMGNGPESTGDGYRYRGRSVIQLTGKSNYAEASQDIFNDDRLVKNPDLALEPETGAKIAVWYWNKRGCCSPARANDIRAVTYKINGGYNGLEDRKEWFRKIQNTFNNLGVG